MFKKIKNNLLWGHHFDEYSYSVTFRHYTFNSEILKKHLLYWRTKGRYKPAKEAVFCACQDFFDECYEREKRNKNCDVEFRRYAKMLVDAAPYCDENYQSLDPKSFLSERWKKFLSEFEALKEQGEENKRAYHQFIFSEEEIHNAWLDLKGGNIEEAASKVWIYAYPQKIASEISIESELDLKEVVFWLSVYCKNGLISKTVGDFEDLYVRAHTLEEEDIFNGEFYLEGELGEPLDYLIEELRIEKDL